MLVRMLEYRGIHASREEAWNVSCFSVRRCGVAAAIDATRLIRYQSQTACHIAASIIKQFCTAIVPFAVDFPVHLASRVEVFPTGAEKRAPGSPARSSTLYFYVGLEHLTADKNGGQESGGLVVVDSDSKPRRSLLVRGVHPQLGGFEVAATVGPTRGTSETGSSDEEQEGEVATVNFLGKQNVRIGGVKDEVERLHAAHRRARRKGDQRETVVPVVLPFLLPDEVEAGSNVVLVQVQIRNDRQGY